MNVAGQPPLDVIDLTENPQNLPALPYQNNSMNVGHPTPFSVIDLTGNPQNLPALPYQNNSMNVENSQPEASSTREQVSTQKAMENVGKKRAREDDTTEPPAKRAKHDFDPESVAYWRIDPNQLRYFQLCDADGTVLHTEKVITQKGERKLRKGYLKLKIKGKYYDFRRDPQDTARLTDHGFAAGSNDSFKVYGQDHHRTNRDFDPESVAYWRINPEQTDELQFCDKDDIALHTEPVMIQYGKRKLAEGSRHKGRLRLNIKHKAYFFKRDSNDFTSLVDSGFAERSDDFFKAHGKLYNNLSLTDIKSVAYWCIHPEQAGYLQLCDADGTVLHIEEVIAQYRERKLSNGYLQIKLNNKQIKLRRDPQDTASLTDHGFAAGSNDTFRFYGQSYSRTNRDAVDPRTVSYWRIDPDQAGYFQLYDADGTVLHTEEVRTPWGERKLNNGYLRLQIKGTNYYFKRDLQDNADLKRNGFIEGTNNSRIRTYVHNNENLHNLIFYDDSEHEDSDSESEMALEDEEELRDMIEEELDLKQ